MKLTSPGIIDDIMSNDKAKWIQKKIQELPKPVQYRAYSAIRALEWSNRIFAIDLPIPAAYSALHATEEAVAAFVTCAKIYNYGDDAKINVKDHQAKATVSFLVTMIINSLQEFKLGITLHNETDEIFIRFIDNGEILHRPGTLNSFSFGNKETKTADVDFLIDLIDKYGHINTINQNITELQNARNNIYYADDDGYPTGFKNPEVDIRNECKKTLALLWACFDIYQNDGHKIPLIEQTLRTAQKVIQELKSKKK